MPLYLIEARPFCNHWYTAASFCATALTSGPLLIAGIAISFSIMTTGPGDLLLSMIAIGLMLEMAGLGGHARSLRSSSSQGAASFYLQMTRYGNAYWVWRTKHIMLLILVS